MNKPNKFEERNPMQFIGEQPPMKRAWRENGRLFFETGEFMLLTDQGYAFVKNSVWEVPEELPTLERVDNGQSNQVEYKATMKAPRLVNIEWKT